MWLEQLASCKGCEEVNVRVRLHLVRELVILSIRRLFYKYTMLTERDNWCESVEPRNEFWDWGEDGV